MREIKFRAWDKEMKKMFEIMELHWIGRKFEVAGCELMQFTGLLDKNGKEIYEGDILLSPFKNHYLVEWDKEAVRFAFIGYGKILVKGHYPVWQFIKAYEVIGNIYENPELLK